MGKVVHAIAYLLLGAVAAGGGAGFFLYQANNDRSALIAKAQEAQRKAEEVATNGKIVTDEANRKLQEAAEEVAKAQARVRALEEEREWFAKAQILTPPRTVSTWKEWLNYTHGFTVKLPLNVTAVKNNASGLDAGWIAIKPYTNETVALETAYAVNGWLLVGSKSETSWIFRVQTAGTIAHVVHVYPNPRVSEQTILNALSTLTFRELE